ncbi:pyridoxal phosphate-dependent decarboxylase family protein [Staphylococcus sp. 11261D007BR]
MKFDEKNIDLQTIIKDEVHKYLTRDISELPATQQAPRELREKYEYMDIPSEGRNVYDVLKDLNNEVLNYLYRPNHPRAFSFIPGPASQLSWLGDILTTANNIHASNFSNATLPINIERNLINYLAGKIGYDVKPSGGVFVSGGSMANLTAIVAARDAQVDLADMKHATVYLTSQTHHSVGKALHVAGFLKKNIRKIDYNEDFTMNTTHLKETVANDIDAGYQPAIVIATAGTTNTGAVDDFTAIADICEMFNLWLHVDGAYGLSHLLSNKTHHLFEGVHRSDSVGWDAHKLLFQTYSCAMVVVKEKQHLMNSYSEEAEYLDDITSDEDVIDPEMLGIELTRPARALKLWITFQVIGEDEIRERIEYGEGLAEYAEDYVSRIDHWRIASHANLSIVNFRYEYPDLTEAENDQLNSIAAQKIADSGFAIAYTTVLNNQRVIRLCTTNPTTTYDDIKETINRLNSYIVEMDTKELK